MPNAPCEHEELVDVQILSADIGSVELSARCKVCGAELRQKLLVEDCDWQETTLAW